MIYRYFSKTGGWRFVVMFHNGRKHVKLLDVSTFGIYKITPRETKALIPYAGIKPKTLGGRIKKTRARLKRCGVGYPKRAVQQTISALEGV